MLYREIIAVCSEIHKRRINTLCGQNVERELGAPCSSHWAVDKVCLKRSTKSSGRRYSNTVCNLQVAVCRTLTQYFCMSL
jgi:hypothetical protein